MSDEPEYIAQNGEPISREERQMWFRLRAKQAHDEKGCTFFRYSLHPTQPHLALVEGWVKPPADQGDQRWQFEAQ